MVTGGQKCNAVCREREALRAVQTASKDQQRVFFECRVRPAKCNWKKREKEKEVMVCMKRTGERLLRLCVEKSYV